LDVTITNHERVGNAAHSVEGPIAWANNALGCDPDLTVEDLQSGLTVEQMATKRADFETCSRDETLATVVSRNRRNQFDFLPVTASATEPSCARGKIVGLVEIARFMLALQRS
jgi:hypothetical protein